MPSMSKKQQDFMRAVAHDKQFAKKVGVPQKVEKEFPMQQMQQQNIAQLQQQLQQQMLQIQQQAQSPLVQQLRQQRAQIEAEMSNSATKKG